MNLNTPESTVIEFLQKHFKNALPVFSSDPSLSAFHELVSDGKEIPAAKEYQEQKGGTLDEAHLVFHQRKHTIYTIHVYIEATA